MPVNPQNGAMGQSGMQPLSQRMNEKEKEAMMTKTMNIEGMMCMHCEATVKKALEALENVASADVSHEKGTAEVKLNSEIDIEILKKAVTEKGYTVL